ncbi:MAG: hypothetical protein MJZ92_02835 [Paludibacteraceae bacterium]|nr:hypothetical protein [Paludibacteraceae bacterium]
MKRISILIMGLAMMLQVHAQYTSQIAICPIVSEVSEHFPQTAKTQLTNKLVQVLTTNGVASSDVLGQFIISAFAVPQEKTILAGPPMQILEQIEITLYIADYTNKVIFASTTLEAKGCGTDDDRSYINAISKMNVKSDKVATFVQEGITKIVAYYDAEADNIMTKARTLAKMKKYDEALYLVTSIPTQCKKYNEANALVLDIYQQRVDQTCNENLALARTTWAAAQNATGAATAGQYLSQIYPDAACYDEAMALYNEIKNKELDDWKFEMKKYQDGIDLEAQRINAAREVGVAYGKGQQPTTTNIGFLH